MSKKYISNPQECKTKETEKNEKCRESSKQEVKWQVYQKLH